MIDIDKLEEKQLKIIKESANKALEDYSKDPINNCHLGYNILRYARSGLYKVEV